MERILDNPGMARRSNISLAILTAVFIYGLWELWHAATVSGNSTDYLFGIAFVGGALYGLNTTLREARDLVVAFDGDPATRQAAITLWRPLRNKRIETSLDQIAGWRHWIETGSRGDRRCYLLARAPSHDGTLRFELQRGMTIPAVLRDIAGEAIADFERETGVRQDEEEEERP